MRTHAAPRLGLRRELAARGVGVGDIARGLAAAGVLLSAEVHLDLWDLQGYRHIHVIGPLFLLNAVSGLTIGVVVLVWRHWLAALAAAGFGAATFAAFWVSVTVGLFGFTESPTGSAQILAEIAEIVAVVFGLLAAIWTGPRRPTRTAGGGPDTHEQP
jgi:hypothetical protein